MVNKLIIILIFFVLTSCVTSVEQLRKMKVTGDTYQSELAKYYLEFAESEADQYDWFNSSYFAKKGIKVLNGENPAPEDLTNWSMPDDMVVTISQARGYLLSLATSDVKKKYPAQAARAQFMFDCWVEQQEENWQQEHIDYCRENFYATLDQLFSITTKDVVLGNLEKDSIQKPEITKIKPENKIAYFKTGSAKLDNKAKRIISTIISRLKDSKNYTITLNGYTDRIGSEENNMKLAKKRAMTIKKALVDGGLNSKNITIFAFGETEGRKKTKDKTAEKENRAVEIIVE